MKYNILICDDERDIVSALKLYLDDENYKLFEAYNGKEALEIVDNNEIHLLLLDIMMPKMNGLETLATLRKDKNIPVILLTAKSEDTDKVLGLNIGADDYVTKPFNPIELLARVKSQIRRYTKLGAQNNNENILKVGEIILDDSKKVVLNFGEEVSLTPKEYGILKLFMENPGVVFSLKDIYKSVWQETLYGSENTVAVHIRHLREKLEINPDEPRHLKVVWGQGYKIEWGR